MTEYSALNEPDPTEEQHWRAFRATRDAQLPSPHGWLSLTSLQWLGQPDQGGEQRLQLVPGWFSATDDVATVRAEASDEIVVVESGEPLQGAISASLDENESLDWLRSGSVLIELARRGGRYAIRTRDAQAPLRTGFNGVPVFDYAPEAVVEAVFSPFAAPEHRTIETANPLVPADASFAGTVSFDIDGVRIVALAQTTPAADDTRVRLLVNFSDATSGEQSPAWRFVTTDILSDEQLAGTKPFRLDFNYALSWPSGFTAFGTCPKPPEENRFGVPILAGEKRLR